ncbi:Coenzyme F420 hydrogenase/dehydrogenase, beta subunit C-terminal domain [Rathayibacter sp. VKM Ac-2630]|uniref:Coenzyme F420 hydrogenase/dehydrogenase, beta subunit C-terminal domain n=1 Tax=Rathayibacter sp. VKM Ac-2630 TaxID=1938617 RepID=UPI0009CBD997|nr:Coenzyme F420 hydrogenase/dehydrogenase, beta subunit C-terminal domain [Rathayibacter sp. VKM Ac-2630]OOB91897.1 hypothetical protein B0T42_03070 [Rathayibacter sp. VKM Ac-2630]
MAAEKLQQGSRVCPFSDDSRSEDDLAASRFGHLPNDKRIGRHSAIHAGRIADDSGIVDSSSGGLTSYALEALLTRDLVDGIINVGRSEGSALFEYTVSSSIDDLRQSRKSAYYATSFTDVLSRIKGDGTRYAIVGVPCFIKAARSLAEEMPDLGAQIKYYIGIVCGHLKSTFFAESLAWQVGVAPDEIASVDFRVKNREKSSNQYDYEVTDVSDGVRTRNVLSTIDGNWGYGAFQPEACNFCDDVFAETADVVFGDAWLPRYEGDWRGTNIVVSRSAVIDEIMQSGQASGALVLDELSIDDAAETQGGNFRHRRDGLRVRLMDDLSKGLSVPAKRVSPGYDDIRPKRIALIRQRRAMSRLSLESFAAARAARDYSLYSKPMSEAVAAYRRIDAASRGWKWRVRTQLGKLRQDVVRRFVARKRG